MNYKYYCHKCSNDWKADTVLRRIPIGCPECKRADYDVRCVEPNLCILCLSTTRILKRKFYEVNLVWK